MDQSILSSRAVQGMYFARLEANPGLAWVNDVSNLFTSDQVSESYAFLGQSPAMREWIGGRQAKGLRSNDPIVIANKHYEATLEIALRDMRRDKTPQIQARLGEFVERGTTHWATLLSALLLAGDSTVCYDGQYYFDTDHAEGDSGSQNNNISVDISALPAVVHGSITQPSKEEMQQAILQAATQIQGFKDDRGEPMNEDAMGFRVIVPTSLAFVTASALGVQFNGAMSENRNPAAMDGMRISMSVNPRLAAWTSSFAVFRSDSDIKGLIRQSETEAVLKMKDEDSDFAFDNDAIQLGIDAWRNVGFGYWQRACKVTLT